jgi:hypothetical protein
MRLSVFRSSERISDYVSCNNNTWAVTGIPEVDIVETTGLEVDELASA